MALEQELATFTKELPNLLRDEGNRGKFALICGNQVHGLWETVEQALEEGYDRFGLQPFLVKEVTDHEEPKYFSRNIKPCR